MNEFSLIILGGLLGASVTFWIICFQALSFGGQYAAITVYFNHFGEGILELIMMTFFVVFGAWILIDEMRKLNK